MGYYCIKGVVRNDYMELAQIWSVFNGAIPSI